MPIIKSFDQHYDACEQWFVEIQNANLSEVVAVHHFISTSGMDVEIGSG
ncbi:MAG TPA: hypothetical protein VGD14_02865 [bacterium]